MTRFTEADLAKFQANSGRKMPASTPSKKTPKYRNKPVTVDGIRFDSKLEANRFNELCMLKASGHIEWFLRQVPIDCGGGVIYRADFMIKWRTTMLMPANVTFEDTTGVMTQAKTNKIKQVKALHGIDVIIVKAPSK
jgi:glycyl-tRNA synthetase (class II)